MKYKKCSRCELNYITEEQNCCSVCLKELRGDKEETDDISFDICPFCEKNILLGGDEMCQQCVFKRRKPFEENEI